MSMYKIRSVVELLRLYRVRLSTSTSTSTSNGARLGTGSHGPWPMAPLAGVRFLRAARASARPASALGNDGMPTPPTPTPKPPSPRPPPPRPCGRFNWAKLVMGSVISLLLAIWTPKWATLLKIGGEAEMAMQEVEQGAEVVEKVAIAVEKISEEVAEKLPEDNKIKEAVLIVEHVSEEAAKDAHIAEEIIHKIDGVKHDLDDVGEMLEPVIEDIARIEKGKK